MHRGPLSRDKAASTCRVGLKPAFRFFPRPDPENRTMLTSRHARGYRGHIRITWKIVRIALTPDCGFNALDTKNQSVRGLAVNPPPHHLSPKSSSDPRITKVGRSPSTPSISLCSSISVSGLLVAKVWCNLVLVVNSRRKCPSSPHVGGIIADCPAFGERLVQCKFSYIAPPSCEGFRSFCRDYSRRRTISGLETPGRVGRYDT